MGERLYNRAARLTLYRPAPAPAYFATEPNATVIERLRVGFEITKTLEAEPNNATITIYNLAESSRAELQRKPLRVRLDAGYDGNLARLFDGDARYVAPPTFGVADVVTKIEAGEGERAFRNARLTRSYPKGVDARQVVKDLAGSMGLRAPSSVDDALALRGQFTGGAAIDGPSERSMTAVLAKHGYGWSVQDGQLQVLGKGAARADVAHLVEQSTGLVGSPEFGIEQADDGSEKSQLKFRTLLYPSIVPGSRVLVRSRGVDGVFIAQRVRHTGDTHGAPWFTDVEAIPL